MKQITLLGSIIGDTIGSIYEFNPTKDYNFNLTNNRMIFTDDSIITIAVADWILHSKSLNHKDLSEKMRYWGNKYDCPLGGYGGMFSAWLRREEMGPYNSWGNGSAMRVSPVGFAFTTLEETLKIAKISAEITHNHIEGIKGAQATAAAIFLARTGKSKEDIRKYISNTFNYNVNQTCNEIRNSYHFNESCQETVPQSLIAFFDSKDFEDAIRLTISLGGDADTMGSITGAVAAAYYKEAPKSLVEFVLDKLPEEFVRIIEEFEKKYTNI
jgi:ADP-ribosylglycohydrolase